VRERTEDLPKNTSPSKKHSSPSSSPSPR
jgi:hypothetical protein